MSQLLYFGQIGKHDAERLLGKYGKDGSFLLRDSQSVQGALCLCVRKAPFVHTYRIAHSPQGWAVEADNSEKLEWFQSLDKLIACYRKLTPSNMVPLLFPFEKRCIEKVEKQNSEKPFYMEM
ncbi:SH2 domain-containing protein 1A-like [Trichomycterus rosablanca]|uniref:SH2 domain-containing protein 1A-like n=1 Tax=Trichomycterus rosablanca TaxID=2290929 RepID=UPI002F34FEC3